MAGYIGSKAVNLSTTGADINGNANIDGDLSFRDNDKAIFGAGSDLQIYHDGNHSRITDSGTGNLRLRGSNVGMESNAGHDIFTGIEGGAATIYHNNAAKLATTSTGVDITGVLSSDNAALGNFVYAGESGGLYLDGGYSTRITSTSYGAANQSMLFYTGTGSGSERMRIDSSGNLLVGTTSSTPHTGTSTGVAIRNDGGVFFTRANADVLNVNRTTSDGAIAQFRKDGTVVGSIGTNSGRFAIYGTDRGIRFTASELMPTNGSGTATDDILSVGHPSYRFKDLHLSGSIEIENGTGNVGVGKNALAVNTADYNTAVGWYAGNAVTGGYNTFVGAYSGGLVSSGTNNTILGRFSGNQSGLDIRTSSNNIVLSDGDGNPRVVVNNVGSVAMGATDPTRHGQTTKVLAYNSSTTTTDFALHVGRVGTGTENQICITNGFGKVGSVTTSGTSTAYNTSSDHRLKENVSYTWDATTRLKQLKPARFNFIADADTTVDGFLAHEAQAVVPEAVHGTKDEVDADGNAVMQGIDQAKLVPLLVKTIQELEARITALENA